MNKVNEMALRLNALKLEYPVKIPEHIIREAIENNIVIVFGSSDDLIEFRGAIETGDYVSTKDLINLTFNLNCYTLIRDVSNLKSVGRNYVLCREVAISADELEKTDLEKIG